MPFFIIQAISILTVMKTQFKHTYSEVQHGTLSNAWFDESLMKPTSYSLRWCELLGLASLNETESDDDPSFIIMSCSALSCLRCFRCLSAVEEWTAFLGSATLLYVCLYWLEAVWIVAQISVSEWRARRTLWRSPWRLLLAFQRHSMYDREWRPLNLQKIRIFIEHHRKGLCAVKTSAYKNKNRVAGKEWLSYKMVFP